ncbi:DHA2 family efflux MFS transporter permease subunit [Rhodomicrobium lacus]|uniref:DHA2 family efflux MFS transporter permease subunit n=1 Tax=Rhodomicrobium lacus TaxID=2498452 RepID=UPI000F8E16AB|nr:DHA2 family efflux MFS transporter permease subunit [Rhodomicrobium lacus]
MIIPLVVACGLFMESLDATVIATSLPAIAASLNEDPITLKLAMTSYLLSLAVFIPISGWVADRYGARRVFMAAIVVFAAGSMLCGLSNGLPEFIAFRILQGIGGAMMVPVGRLLILRSVPKHELIRALAWLTIPAMFGPVVGPPLGGFITTYLDWRWIFYVNVPIGALGLFLSWRFFENIREERSPPLDRTGFVLSGLALAAIVFGLALLGETHESMLTGAAMTLGGVVFGAAYVRHAFRVDNPVIDLRLLGISTFRAGVIGGSVFRIGIGAMPFLLPLMLQLCFGLSPFQSGMLTLAAAAGALVMKTTAPVIIRRFGFRNVLIVNAAISSAFIALSGFFTDATPHAAIVAILLAGGFFRSLEFTAINALAYADIKPSQMSRATSFASVAQQVSLSLGVAIGALVLQASQATRGEPTLTQADFATSFWVVAALSALATVWFWRLPEGAGASLSYRPETDREADSASGVHVAVKHD